MEPRLDAEVATINAELDTKITNPAGEANIASNAVTNTKIADGAVTSAKIANDTIVDADVNSAAAIAATKVQGTLPAGGNVGQVLAKSTTSDYATTWVDGTALPASQVKQLVKNDTGATIPKGSVVYFSGANGTNILIALSDADTEATSSKTVGLTETAINNGASGYVVSEGLLSGLNTNSATAGQSVWLSTTAGEVVYGAPPAKPAHSVYLGLVTKANPSTGEIFVKVQNGYELEELHNVSINSGTLTNGQALTYDSATQLWKNATPASTLDALTDVTITSGTLSGGQVIKYDAGTTQWVNGAAAGGVTAAATAPNLATSAAGDAWFDTNDGTLYVCYVDVDSTKQWVQVQANSALEASILSRLGALEASNVAAGTTSPNYIINGGMDVWQRGTSGTAGASVAFAADRWQSVTYAGGTMYWFQQPAVGNPSGTRYCTRVQRASGATNAATTNLAYSFETTDVLSIAGKTMTLSYYARAGANYSPTGSAFNHAVTWGTGTDQAVFTGAGITGGGDIFRSSVALTTSWQRFTVTFTVPSGATSLGISLYSGTNVGTAGAADYWDITGMQLERGNTPTAFRRNQPNLQAELSACKRYYQISYTPSAAGPTPLSVVDGGLKAAAVKFEVEMRATPTFSYTSSASVAQNGLSSKQWWGYSFSTGERYIDSWTASSEL
jgi:hypothetical protein